MMSTDLKAVILAGLCGLIAFDLPAQQYPVKPVRLVVSSSAGSGADMIGRLIGAELAAALEQQVLVENRAGAGGNIAAEIVAKAVPDGYMVLQANVSHTSSPSLYSKLQYDLLRDLAPVTLLASSPQVVVVHPSLPVKSVKELLALAKARPGAINYAHAGTGASSFLCGELFKSLGGVNIVHVPYRGGGEVHTSVLSGETSVSFLPVASSLPLIRQGRLRALGVSTASRIALMPDTPTVAEAGIPGYEFAQWYGLMVPVNTPRNVVTTLHKASVSALGQPALRRRLDDLGYLTVGNQPEAFAAYIRADIEKIAKIVREAGIKPN